MLKLSARIWQRQTRSRCPRVGGAAGNAIVRRWTATRCRQAWNVDRAWNSLAAGQTVIERLRAAAIAMQQAALRIAAQQIGDDVTIAADLHHVRSGEIAYLGHGFLSLMRAAPAPFNVGQIGNPSQITACGRRWAFPKMRPPAAAAAPTPSPRAPGARRTP